MQAQSFVKYHGKPKVILLGLDVLAVILAALLTYLARYVVGPETYDLASEWQEPVLRITVLFLSLPLQVYIFRQNLLYKYKVYTTGASQFALLLRSILINALILIAVIFFVRADILLHSRSNLFLFVLFEILLFTLLRVGLFRKKLLPILSGWDQKRVLIIGTGEVTEQLLALAGEGAPIRIVGLVDMSQSHPTAISPIDNPPVHHVPIYHLDTSLEQIIRETDAHEVVLAEENLGHEDILHILNLCKDLSVSVQLLGEQFRVIHEKVTRNTSEYLGVASAGISAGLSSPYSRFLKRPFDLIGALVILVVISPVLLAISLLVLLSSSGPLLFRTTVIGREGKPFEWYKFRTMRIGDAPTLHREHVREHIRLADRPTGKLANDPRITNVGKFLRKHSLDELPQLWNVLTGSMSLIGPRPSLPYEYAEFQNWHKKRFVIRPGITGLWQVSGRSSVSFNDMVILDLYYIHNLSFWLDAAIIFRTVGVVITGKGGG